jgi:hypothetical protein
VQPEPGNQDPDHMRYLVRAEFEHHDVISLVITLSTDGQAEGLELYPRAE